MALTNLITSFVLDVYDHDSTPASVKAIALDKQTRYIKATLTYRGADYPVDENATVTLTVIRPDKTGVQVTGSVADVDNADRTGTIKGVYAELSQTALAVKGNLRAQFMISVGGQILRTEIFSIKTGEALDADVSEWAGEYQGYNLDELVEKVEALQTETGSSGISGDGITDVTSLIESALTDSKICTLGAGDFVIGNLTMPDGTMLKGAGDATRLYFDPNASGSAIKMGSRCTVKDLALYGADEDIEIPESDFEPSAGSTNYIGASTVGDGNVKFLLTQELPPGSYRIIVNATSDMTGRDTVNVKTLSIADSYATAKVLTSDNVAKNTDTVIDITVEDTIRSIRVFAGNSAAASVGSVVTVNSIAIYDLTALIGIRHGIKWAGESVKEGVIDNCRIERFSGGGIIAMDTGTPVDHNIYVTNCSIRNCIVGIYIRRNSEYHKICSNVVTACWYGMLNRGGNNYISCCGFDGNRVGVQLDNDEGSNGGHGVIAACSMNHSGDNEGYGLIIRGTGREMVSGCNIMASKVLLKNTNGNIISGCGFKTTAWEVDGGGCSVFTNCMVLSLADTPITITNNNDIKIVSCYARDGSEVTA